MNPLEKEILEKFSRPVEDRGCFIVGVKADADRNITVTVECENRSVDMDDCVELDRVFHEMWNRDEVEDYSLTITSAGLDSPLTDPRQLKKFMGEKVDVRLRGGKKFTAALGEADADGVTLSYTVKEKPEGEKRKVEIQEEEKIPFSEINSIIPHISFE